MRILGVTRVGDDRRIYLPKSVRERLGPRVSVCVSAGRVVMTQGENQVDGKWRIWVNGKILKHLGADKGDMLVYLEDRGKIYLAKADRVRASLG